ncbi:MAG: rhodanese-like domain-containing protein, partial [Caldimicrobium sp.]
LLSVFIERFIPLLKEDEEERTNLNRCIKCNEFTVSPTGICTFCRRKELIERLPNKKLELTAEEWLEVIKEEQDKDWVIFDVRDEEAYKERTLPQAKWLSADLLKDKKILFQKIKPYKSKKLLFFCSSGRLGYLFTLALRKMGFEAYNLKNPESLFQAMP